MRCTQVIGLSKRASKFLVDNLKIEMKKCNCPDCKTQHREEMIEEVYDKETGVQAGMFDDGPELSRYRLKDDTWIYEYVQCDPWSSGPMIFLALRKEDGSPIQETLWTDEEITKY